MGKGERGMEKGEWGMGKGKGKFQNQLYELLPGNVMEAASELEERKNPDSDFHVYFAQVKSMQ